MSSTLELIGITDLVAVNLQCFGLIILGYLSRRFNLIGPEEAKGLNIFVSYFSLPAMIFHSLATLPLSNIDFNFVGSILVSKSIIFIGILLFTFALSYKSCSTHFSVRRSAIFAIFCTQSNDFALGYPLLESLYGTSSSSLANYLYILAPIQLLLLNPIALLLIEISKNLEQNSLNSIFQRFIVIVKIIFQKIFINPIILATFLGIVVNLCNHESLPQVTVSFFQVLAQSFSSIALFLLGLNLHGNFKLLKNFSQPLLVTLVLISVKIFFMPMLNRFLVQHLAIFPNERHNETLSEFAFLYGTFPAAPTVYIFSNIYDIETLIISTGLVISTLFSAPLMFVSANMIRLSSFINYDKLNADLIDTIFYVGAVSAAGSILLALSFFNGYKLRSLTHRYSFKILFSHLLVLCGGFLYRLNQHPESAVLSSKLSIAQYMLFHVGLFSLKIWTCFLSLILVFLYAKSLCYTVQISHRFVLSGCTLIAFFGVFLGCTLGNVNFSQPPSSPIDLYYGLSKLHLSVSIFVSGASIVTLVISLILLHRFKCENNYETLYDTSESADNPSPSEVSPDNNVNANDSSTTRIRRITNESYMVEVEDLFVALPQNNRRNEDFNDTCGDSCHAHCGSRARKQCGDRLQRYMTNIENAIEAADSSASFSIEDHYTHQDFHQVYHHMYLLLFLALSIFIHLAIEVYHLVQDKPTGIYVEIEFLDILLTFSQGFIIFVIFGFDIDLIIYKLSNIFTLSLRLNQIYLPPVSSLSFETIEICEEFRQRSLPRCYRDITFNVVSPSLSTSEIGITDVEPKQFFCGNKLVDWLLQEKIVNTREEGLEFGRHLLYGRVIEHITREHFFCDNTFYYRFI